MESMAFQCIANFYPSFEGTLVHGLNFMGFSAIYNTLKRESPYLFIVPGANDLLLGILIVLATLLVLAVGLYRSRKKHGEALRQIEGLNKTLDNLNHEAYLHRNMVDLSLGYITTHTLDGIILSVNPSACQALGHLEKDLIGLSIESILHPSFKPHFQEYLDKIKKEEKTSGWMRIVTGSGHEKIWRYQNRKVHTEKGGDFVIGYAQDYTEIQLAHNEKAIEHKRLISIMKNSPDIFVTLDETGTIKYINRTSGGLNIEDVLHKNIRDILPPSQVETRMNNITAVYQTKKTIESEFEFQGRTFISRTIPIIDHDKVIEVSSIATDITDLLQNKAIAKTLETRFRKIYEHSPNGICIISVENNRYIQPNQAFCNLLGYTEQELLEKTFLDITHPDDLAEDLQLGKKLISRELPYYTLQKRYLHKNGYPIWTLITASILDNDAGMPQYYVSQVQDISKLKKMEEMLLKKQHDLNLLVSSLDDVIFICDRQGTLLDAWTKNENQLFMPRAEFINRTIEEAFETIPTLKNKLWATFLKTRNLNEIQQVEYASPLPGSSDWFRAKFNPVKNEMGKTEWFSIQVTNITTLKNNQIQIERLSMITQKTSNVVMITDTKGHLVWANESFKTLSGYSLEEVMGKPVESFLHGPDTDLNTLAYIQKQVSRTETFSCEILNYSKSKRPYWVKIFGQPYFGQDGTLLGYFAVQQDITELKSMMDNLIHERNRAQESDRIKTLFLGNFSHEVRTPLNAIIGFSDILKNPNLSQEKREEGLSIIRKRSNDLLELLNSIMEFAKFENEGIAIVHEPVNAYETFNQVFETLRQESLLNTKPIQFDFKNKVHSDKLILVNPFHVSQACLNLFSNAVKFTETGMIQVGADIQQGNVLFSIKDTGIGIEPEKTDHIFMPFRQAHEGLTRKKDGIGLGLTISKRLIESWGGKINFETIFGQGSAFYFTIPIKG